jgi:hypothetical protein
VAPSFTLKRNLSASKNCCPAVSSPPVSSTATRPKTGVSRFSIRSRASTKPAKFDASKAVESLPARQTLPARFSQVLDQLAQMRWDPLCGMLRIRDSREHVLGPSRESRLELAQNLLELVSICLSDFISYRFIREYRETSHFQKDPLGGNHRVQ